LNVPLFRPGRCVHHEAARGAISGISAAASVRWNATALGALGEFCINVVSWPAVSVPDHKPRSVLVVEDEVQSRISVDLLSTDVRMLGSMHGIQLAKFLHEIRLQLKVIVASGQSSPDCR
jgi:hypothetical protein